MKLAIAILAGVLGAFAQAPDLQPGDDIVVSTGAVMDYITHQAASVTTVQLKAASIMGRPTYSSTTIEYSNFKPGTPAPTSSTLSVHTGFTQVLLKLSRYSQIWVNTEAGITKLDFASLGNISGAAGISWDVGARFTGGKHHVWVAPYLRQLSIASLQNKPIVGFQIGTGFAKPTGN